MQRLVTILFTLLLLVSTPAQADVNMSATWQRPSVARVAWSQPAGIDQTCLYRAPVNQSAILLNCWGDLPQGNTGLALPGATGNDHTRFPAVGDVYTLTMDSNIVASAPLRAVLRLPAFYV